MVNPSTEEDPTLKRLRERDEKKWMCPKVVQLRQKLAHKAKTEPRYKFYSLYNQIFRMDVLKTAWRLVQENKGAPGVDNVTIKDIENQAGGYMKLLEEIHSELKNKTYKSQHVKRVYIPKTDGSKRPLGIPVVKDRIVQMAVVLVLEPIFEADFLDCSYGFRPGISAHDGIREIARSIKKGMTIIYDADMKGYFDSIPHDKLMKCLLRRVVDSSVLNLIRMWLRTPVVEPPPDKGGKPTITRPSKGTPQGGVISPLLSNIYFHCFDKVFHGSEGPSKKIGAKLVRYADDFVVLMRYHSAETLRFIKDKLVDWMGLEINEVKTKIVNMDEDGSSIDFLGFNIRLFPSSYNAGKYPRVEPKKKAFEKAKDNIRGMTSTRNNWRPIDEMIKALNMFLGGWSGYFKLGNPFEVFAKLDDFTRCRVRRNLKNRSQREYKKGEKQTWYEAIQGLGLMRLAGNVRPYKL